MREVPSGLISCARAALGWRAVEWREIQTGDISFAQACSAKFTQPQLPRPGRAFWMAPKFNFPPSNELLSPVLRPKGVVPVAKKASSRCWLVSWMVEGRATMDGHGHSLKVKLS